MSPLLAVVVQLSKTTCIVQDYHRFHLPVSGTIRCIRHVRGKLYTVNPIAVASTYANVFTQVLIDLTYCSISHIVSAATEFACSSDCKRCLGDSRPS